MGNSIIKTTSPKIRFLCDKVRNKYELESMLNVQSSILKVGWGRLARIEFMRSTQIPAEWQQCINPPPIVSGNSGEAPQEWHLNRPCVTWNHHQMKHNYPHYVKFLEEFTLRAKKNKMWNKQQLEAISTKEMEQIVGNALRQKYARTRSKNYFDWNKKEEKKRQHKRAKRLKSQKRKAIKVQKL